MSASSELREGFFEECEELLEALSDGLSEIESGTADQETVNAVFRAVHSVKGGAGAFGLEAIVSFAHCFENVLDDVRAGQLEVTPEIVQTFFQAGDRLSDLIEQGRDGNIVSQSVPDALENALRALSPGQEEAEDAQEEVSPDAFMPIGLSLDIAGFPEPSETVFEIRFTPKKALYLNGNDATLLIRTLQNLGQLEVTADISNVPVLSEMEWEDPYMSWVMSLSTHESEQDIRDIFEFVEGQCDLTITRQDEGALIPEPLPEVVEPITEQAEDVVNSSTPPIVEPEKPQVSQPKAPTKTTIRVDLDRVDRLINIVGEMVISEAMLTQSIAEMPLQSGSQVEAAMTQLKQLSSELQESVMAIRAQPVKPLFQRMSRIVREAAQETEKNVRFVTEGDSVEVDKTVIERLVDPLTHMIRNAIDHGIESPEARKQVGKTEQGCVKLSAAHRSGRVIIELSDDGGGVNREKVLMLAKARGLVSDDAELSDNEIDNLLFLPGFSTNDTVSSLSGRGVGMDVVKNEIRSLGGRVFIQSDPGAGTTLSVSLPLTLAVLEGMVVEVAGETVVIPTTALRETVRADEAGIQNLGSDDLVMPTSEGLVPVIDLGANLGYRQTSEHLNSLTLLLVESENGKRVAVGVDRVVDQREVVIKGLDASYGFIPGIAAATIIGNGRIALIIDTDQLQPEQRRASGRDPSSHEGVRQYG